ncbi:MAG: hypothetical protein GY855_08430 [candidate division Zixibacteria bacterium]|nr:hypothetical protein [candidate division Zixibacteria bacterium]
MKIRILTLIIAISIFISCSNESDVKNEMASTEYASSGNDFRNANWGMSIEEVKQTEDVGVFIEEMETRNGYRITYNSKIEGIPSTLSYYFKDNKFMQAGYEVVSESGNFTEQELDEKFNILNKMLISKYGEPKDKMDSRAAGIFRIVGRWYTPSDVEVGLMADKTTPAGRLVLNFKSPEQHKSEKSMTTQNPAQSDKK